MRLRTKGIQSGIYKTIVGKITFDSDNFDINNILIVKDEVNLEFNNKFAGYITTSQTKIATSSPIIFNIPDLSHLQESDIVSLDNLGNVNTLYRVNSLHNSILVTERCNSNCLMCSQPPKDIDDVDYLFDVHSRIIPLIPKDCLEIGITGGEPTLLREKFYALLELLYFHLPNTSVHILTNGRSFAQVENAKKLASVNHNGIMLGIPLYSDYYASHDYIVQAKDAFNQTVIGLHNLARYQQRIEIRIVLHKLTIPRLIKLSEFIYKNLPFVAHVAFMGLENTGYTPHNIEKLWIDPFDFMDELKHAVLYLDSFGMNVSIYNLQLCILPSKLWRFARKSISDWKNIYLPECSECIELNNCGGFFASCLTQHSKYISPIKVS